MVKKLSWSRFLKLLQTGYVWGVLALPLAFHAFPGTNKFDFIQSFTPFYAIAAYALLGLLLFLVGGKDEKQARTPWPLWLFIGWSTLSFALADVWTFGFAETFVMWTGATFFLLFSAPRSRKLLRQYLPRAIVLTLGIHVLAGTYAFLTTDHLRFFGLFYNPSIKADAWPNAFAAFFLLAFPLVLAAFQRKKGLEWLKIVVLGVFLAGFWVTFSRAAFIAFGIELVLLFVFFRKDIRLQSVLIRGGTVFLISLVIAGGLQYGKSLIQPTTDVTDRLTFSEETGGTSISERLEFFTGSFQLIAEDPFLGSGPVSFKSVYPRVQEGFLSISDHPHNILLKYAVERGVPAAVFFVLFLFLLFWTNSPFDKKVSALERFAWVGALSLLAHSMVDFNLNFFSIVLPWWLVLALLFRPLEAKRNYFIVLLTLLIVGTAGYQFWYRTRGAEVMSNPTVENVERYASLLPKWDLVALYNGLESDTLNLRLAVVQKQLEYDPYDHHALAALADLAAEQERIDDALRLYEQLLAVYPVNTFEYYLDYARFMQSNGIDDGLELLKERVNPLIEEFQDLEARNVHFIQAKNEDEYVAELEEILEL